MPFIAGPISAFAKNFCIYLRNTLHNGIYIANAAGKVNNLAGSISTFSGVLILATSMLWVRRLYFQVCNFCTRHTAVFPASSCGVPFITQGKETVSLCSQCCLFTEPSLAQLYCYCLSGANVFSHQGSCSLHPLGKTARQSGDFEVKRIS